MLHCAGTVELYYLSFAGKALSFEQLLQTLSTGQWPTREEDHEPSRRAALARHA
jgi:hypothetical protein